MNSIIEIVIKYILKTWKNGNRRAKNIIILLSVFGIIGIFIFLFAAAILPHDSLEYRVLNSISIAIAIVIAISIITGSAYSGLIKEEEIESKIEEKENT